MMSRIEYLDLAKGIGIILMILGHCYWKESIPYFNSFVYSFHMPLFFIISGYFMRSMTLSDSVAKFFLRFLRPYILTCFLCLIPTLLYSLLSNDDIYKLLCDWFTRTSFGSGSDKGDEIFAYLPIIGPLWFLFASFWGSLIFSIILRYKGLDLFCLVFFFFVVSYCSNKYIRLPFSIQAGMSSIIYLYVGSLMAKYDVINRFNYNWINVSCIIFVWLIIVKYGFISISHCIYGLGLISVLGSIGACFIILKFLSVLTFRGGYLGKLTLSILCAHQIIQYFYLLNGSIYKKLPYHPIVNFIIEGSCEIILALIIAYLLRNLPLLKKVYDK